MKICIQIVASYSELSPDKKVCGLRSRKDLRRVCHLLW